MLAGQQQLWLNSSVGEGVGDGRKLDRFGPGADDQVDSFAAQASP